MEQTHRAGNSDENARYRRVLVWFVAALVVIQALSGGVLIDRQRTAYARQATDAATAELDLIETLVREPLLRRDYSTVVEFLENWGARKPDILRLEALAANGFVFAQYDAGSVGEAAVTVHRAITDSEGRDLAQLRIMRDQGQSRRELDRLGRQLLLGGIVITALLGATLWIILSRLGLRPLQSEIRQRRAAEEALRAHRDSLDDEVTQRTRALAAANRALRQSEARWRSLVQHAPDFVVSVDRDLRVVFANRTPPGLPLTSWVGHRVGDLVATQDRDHIERTLRRVIDSRQPAQAEARAAGPHGHAVWYQVHIGPLLEGDRVEALTVIARDITERRRTEAVLREKSRRLEVANEEFQQLVYVIAHDLRGPLRAVSHLSTALEEEIAAGAGTTAETLPLTQRLRGRVQRMHGLIDALLQFTQAGHEQPPVRVDLRRLVADVAKCCTPPSGFQVGVVGAPTLVETDAQHLRQVLANLIANAVQHHGGDGGRAEVAISERADGLLQISVSDDGPGIPERYRERVFGLFQTLETRDRKESTGIGLALVKKIVENAGGQVWLDTPERGTRVHFTWPHLKADGGADLIPMLRASG